MRKLLLAAVRSPFPDAWATPGPSITTDIYGHLVQGADRGLSDRLAIIHGGKA